MVCAQLEQKNWLSVTHIHTQLRPISLVSLNFASGEEGRGPGEAEEGQEREREMLEG